MSFIVLDLNDTAEAAELDLDQAINRLQAWFPEAAVLPGDQLARSVERAEAFFAEDLSKSVVGPEAQVVESLRRKASRYGPSFAFRIPVDPGKSIQGSARRVDITFLYDDPLPDHVRDRLVDFLKTFGVGRIEGSAQDGKSTDVIFNNGAGE